MKRDQWFAKEQFWQFFLPALMSSVALAVGGIADTIYVGNALGDNGLFVLGIASPVYMVFTTLSVGIAAGGAIHFASALGEGKEAEGRKIFSSVIVFDFVSVCFFSMIGLIFAEPLVRLFGCTPDMAAYDSILGYLRTMMLACPILFLQAPLHYFVHTDNAPNLASASLVIGCVVDCICGYIFIAVLDWGVKGSIWSTLCGALVMELVCVSHLIRGEGALSFKKFVMPEMDVAKKAFYTGFATAAQYLYLFVVLLVFNRILLKISGESAVAGYDIAINAGALVIAIMEAIVLAMIPLVSTYYGERNRAGIRGSLKISLLTGIILTTVCSGLMIIFAREYCDFAGLSPLFLDNGAYALMMYMFSMLPACVNTIFAAYFQNIGLEKWSYMIIALRGLVVLLPSGILLSLRGFEAFWFCYLCTEVLVLVIVLALFLHVGKTGKNISKQFQRSMVFSETFVGSCAQISDICERIQRFLEDNGANVKRAYFVTLAVDETCRLIADNGGTLMLQLTLVMEDEQYTLHIRDNAHRFNPFEISEGDERGLGLKIVKNQAKDFYYRQFVGFNTLTIVFGGD